MLLKVTIKEKTDFLPQLKIDGEFYQAPKTLHNGDALEVKDFIGYGLMAAYKGAFEVIQADPIKDAVDNTIRKEDVNPELRKKRMTKDVKAASLSRQEAVNNTVSEYSELAADIVAGQSPAAEGDKNALNEKARAMDAKQATAQHADAQAKAAKEAADKAAQAKAAADKAASAQVITPAK